VGSLDHGIDHPTSFGLTYYDDTGHMHRILTYSNRGGTTADHAQAIWDTIDACVYTHHSFPKTIVFDPSMVTVQRLNHTTFRSHIDEYKDLFAKSEKSRHVQFVPANNRKPEGCQMMKNAFAKQADSQPGFFYFDGANRSFVDSVRRAQRDENNAEIYAKADGDDECDEARYGICQCKTMIGNRAVQAALRANEPREVPKEFSYETVGQSWMG
jgi:hypothetical protein